MPNFFISPETIQNSYQVLTETKFNYGTEFFYILILKHAGISQHDFINLTDDSVKNKIIDATKKLSWLFLSEENFNNKSSKHNFINPFAMLNWDHQPSESIKTWSPARLVNNITGGGKQWKKILVSDDKNPNIIKLRHDYLEFFVDMTVKYPLDAISIWFFKFFKFNSETALSSITTSFYEYFNIEIDERTFFFSSKNNFSLVFTTTLTEPQFIRSLIGNPKSQTNWLDYSLSSDQSSILNSDFISYNFKKSAIENYSILKNTISYKNMLTNANQAIMMGPPGTSKSYMANLLSNEFTHTKKIQFHPQYSYQDFIGGKILDNGTLKDKKGEFIVFLEKAISSPKSESFLLIIEEINRANVSQVFGELIQLLDRNEKLILSFNGIDYEYFLPNNFKIIGTMNTTDRTVGRIDYAIKRRFYQIYLGVDYDVLVDNVSLEGNSFAISDLLQKINSNLLNVLNNKEMVIGHAIFLKEFTKDLNTSKYIWKINDFAELFNFVVFPIVEDYCNGNLELISNIIGEQLGQQLSGDEFMQAVQEFLTR